MGYCSVLGCKNRSTRKDASVSFHSFPVDLEKKNKWIQATGRQNWYPKKYAKICSIHFEINSFIVSSKITHLIPSAVPNKFIYNEGSSEKSPMSVCESSVERFTVKTNGAWATKKIETRTKRKSEDSQNIPQIKKQCLIKNATNPTSSRQTQKTAQEIQKKLDQQKEVSANRLRKLRAVRESKRRLAKKVADLENDLTYLKYKLLINTEESEVPRSFQ